jgi:hypothetical protein
MIVSYDIDGVLAQQPPPNNTKWGLMNGIQRKERLEFLNYWYANANKLIEPKEQKFYAISARKNNPLTLGITKSWLNKNYPNQVIEVYLLNKSRSVNNVIEFKSAVIKHFKIQRHYEDNKKILKGIRKELPNVELYFWEKGMDNPIVFE